VTVALTTSTTGKPMRTIERQASDTNFIITLPWICLSNYKMV
jgi:hypothetical protein